MEKVTMFPRGKGDTHAGDVKKGVKRALGQEDALFGASKRSKKIEVVSKKSSKPKHVASLVPTLGLGMHLQQGRSKKPMKIESLSRSKMTSGVMALGIVLSVSAGSALVSLPGGIVGKVDLVNAADPLQGALGVTSVAEVVEANQLVRCCVLGGDPADKYVPLSLRCSVVNRGLAFKHLHKGMSLVVSVESKEDHGYIVTAGISNTHLFLSDKESLKFGASLSAGKLLNCIVQDINAESRTVSVKHDADALEEEPIKNAHLPFLALAPGMLFDVVVDKVVENGLLVSYLNLFHGMLDLHSLAHSYTHDWKATVSEGKIVQARVVLVDHGRKSVRLSMRPHILLLCAPQHLPALGAIVSSLVVRAVNKKTGIVLSEEPASMTEGAEEEGEDEEQGKKLNRKGRRRLIAEQRKKDGLIVSFILSSSNLAVRTAPASEGVEESEVPYEIGEEVEAVRVKGYHLVEGTVIASNIDSFLRGAVIHHSDIKAGQKHKVTIKAVLDSGVAVRIGGKIDAFCPLQHTADVVVEGKLHKKFKAGQQLNMKVWETKNGGIIMTNKKSLVDTNGNDVISWDDLQSGKKTIGLVDNISSDGVVVRFFNKVRAILPAKVLAEQSVLDPAEAFRVGQTVKVIVLENTGSGKGATVSLALDLNVDQNGLQHLLSLLPSDKPKDGSAVLDATVSADSEAGFVSGTVFRLEASKVFIRLADGRTAVAEKHQFFDHSFAADAIFSSENCPISVGYVVKQAVIIGSQDGNVVVSLKPLLLHAAGHRSNEEISFPREAADLSPGQVVAGYIFKVEVYGVMVKFGNNLTALVPRPNIADRFVNTPVGLFHVGDSVRCMVQRVDLTKGRVIATFKSSLVPASSGPHSYLLSYLEESCKVAELRSAQEQKILPSWQRFALGTVISATVSSIETYGLILLGNDQTTLMLDRSYASGKETVVVGQEVKAMVLDIDFDHCVLQVSVLKRGSKKKDQRGQKGKADKLSTGDQMQLKVELVKAKYLVVSDLEKLVVGYVSLVDFHCPEPLPSAFAEGQMVSLKVDRPALSGSGQTATFPHANGLLLCLVQDSASAVVTNIVRVSEVAKETDGADGAEDEEEDNSGALKRKFLKRIKVGARSRWVVKSLNTLEVQLVPADAEGCADVPVLGRMHISNYFQSFANTDDLQQQLEQMEEGAVRVGLHAKHPFAGLKVGKTVWGQVLQVRGSSVSADDEQAAEPVTVYLRPCLKSDEDAEQCPDFHFLLQCWGRDAVHSRALYHAVVTSFNEHGCSLALSPYVQTKMFFTNVSADQHLINLFRRRCFVGLQMIVVVTELSTTGGKVHKIHVNRCLIESLLCDRREDKQVDIASFKEKDLEAHLTERQKVKPGDLVVGTLNLDCRRVVSAPAVMIALQNGRYGRVCVSELADPADWADMSALLIGKKQGDQVTCRVLSESDGCVELSLRPSRLDSSIKPKKAIKADPIPAVGSVVQGHVINVGPKGCFVRLSATVTGRVKIKDLADGFVAQPENIFKAGQLVTGRVREVVEGQVQLTLRPAEVEGRVLKATALQNIQDGDVLKGVVHRIADVGVFVQIAGTDLVGLARKEQALQDARKTLQDEYAVGDVVRAKVMRVSREAGKIALALTEAFFKSTQVVQEAVASIAETPAPVPVAVAVPAAAEKKSKKRSAVSESAAQAPPKLQKIADADSDDELGPLRWGTEEEAEEKANDIADSSDGEESADEENGGSKSVKLRTKQKEALRKKDEQALREKERALADGVLAPQRPEDFERLLIAEPNSSFLWVQYIAYHVKNADIEAARLLAQRALRAIHFREISEKFNVWMAWLNLEYKYGTKESLELTLKEAVVESKGKNIMLSLARIYEEAADYANAETLLTKALKKPVYKKSKKVWMALQQLQLKARHTEAARATLARSLQSLSKHKHVETISHFALAEFDFGSEDKARQLLEDLLEHYPKRTDLWHLYVDREIKLGHLQQARQLFERMIAAKSTTRNMKTVFKKYLALEMRCGDAASQQAVKDKAAAYVNSLA